jgi:uncharacterized Zn finger protein (UPF0148 family)
MTLFEIFCESCNTDAYIETERYPKFCPVCGSEIDETNIAEEEWQNDVDNEWNKISEEFLHDSDE